LALASIDPEKRTVFVDGIGQHGAESMILASMPGHILWTDDHVVSRLALGEFGVRRAWTQGILQALAEQGVIEGDYFFEASAKLLGWGYYFTSSSVPVLMKSATLANWQPESWPLKQALEVFEDQSVDLQVALQLAVGFLVMLYNQTVLPETQNRIIFRFLDRLASRRHGLKGIEAIADNIPRIFGLNAVRAQQAEKAIRHWIANFRSKGFEILP
jgi:hypothetical protein